MGLELDKIFKFDLQNFMKLQNCHQTTEGEKVAIDTQWNQVPCVSRPAEKKEKKERKLYRPVQFPEENIWLKLYGFDWYSLWSLQYGF